MSITSLILLFGTCLLLTTLYWQIVYYVLQKAIRYQLFALRDDARRLAVEKNLGSSEAFHDVERFICKTIRFIPSISILSYFNFVIRHRTLTEKMKEDGARMIDNWPQEFVLIRNATARAAIAAMCLNSPWVIGFTPIFLLSACILTKEPVNAPRKVYSKTERFVEEIRPEIIGVLPQPA